MQRFWKRVLAGTVLAAAGSDCGKRATRWWGATGAPVSLPLSSWLLPVSEAAPSCMS